VVENDTGRISNSVQPDGDLIRRDRIEQGFTQEALLERCRAQSAHFSIQSLRRAERGERVARSTAEGIARALGKPDQRYYRNRVSGHALAPKLVGEWRLLAIEDDRLSPPYLIEENLHIDMTPTGALTLISHAVDFPRTEIYQNIVMIDDMIMGQVFIKEWIPPNGFGTFQLQILRENTFLDGYVTWYDADSKRIEASRTLALRKDIKDYETCLDTARGILARDLDRFAQR
jgi:transcriptional regulator with XRE-family HTH domain